MELKYNYVLNDGWAFNSFNRTAYGIEIGEYIDSVMKTLLF